LVKAGLQPDSQRYFDYHHAANDTLRFVKEIRNLVYVTMASLIYLIDQNGIVK
jgi:hypothetical protein